MYKYNPRVYSLSLFRNNNVFKLLLLQFLKYNIHCLLTMFSYYSTFTHINLILSVRNFTDYSILSLQSSVFSAKEETQFSYIFIYLYNMNVVMRTIIFFNKNRVNVTKTKDFSHTKCIWQKEKR